MYSCETDCFTNLIGLRDICVPKEIKSCYYLDDIGISRFSIEQIITKNYTDVSTFFQNQLDLAINQVTAEIHSKFAPKYRANSILEGQRMGFLQDNKSVKTTNSKWAGIYVELINSNSYLDYYVSEILLTTDFTGVIPVKVYDVYTGTPLTTINLTTVAGQESVIDPNEIFKSKRKSMKLFFCYDTTGINSYNTQIKEGGCRSCGSSSYTNQYISARGMYSSANTFLYNDLVGADHTFGMSTVYSLACNHKNWICSHVNILTLPILYKLAANILLYGLQASPDQRVNNKITINRDKMELDQAFYDKKYQEEMFTKLNSMQVPTDSKCYQCYEPYRTALVLP